MAVFLALGIGVLLGVALGEEGIVSGASRDLEKSLRGDLDQARSRNAELRRELAQRRGYEREVYPALVGGLLPDWRVGVVAMGRLPGGYISSDRAGDRAGRGAHRERLGDRVAVAPRSHRR